MASINELTSLDLQVQSWLNKKNTNPHWSYVEFTSCYFDDLILGEGYKQWVSEGFISPEEYTIVKDWHERLASYVEPDRDIYNPVAILNDREWLSIVEEGRIAKLKLAEILNEDEQKALMEEIDPTSSYVWP